MSRSKIVVNILMPTFVISPRSFLIRFVIPSFSTHFPLRKRYYSVFIVSIKYLPTYLLIYLRVPVVLIFDQSTNRVNWNDQGTFQFLSLAYIHTYIRQIHTHTYVIHTSKRKFLLTARNYCDDEECYWTPWKTDSWLTPEGKSITRDHVDRERKAKQLRRKIIAQNYQPSFTLSFSNQEKQLIVYNTYINVVCTSSLSV